MTVDKYFLNKQQDTIVAEVALKRLAEFVDKGLNFLFLSNIRNYLGKKNKVNEGIEETYRNHPKNFWFYNNGITIVCDNFDDSNKLKDGAAKVIITTPQIVNGCQTANTIYTCWKNSSQESKNTQEGTILVKIIKDTNSKRKDITRYTNNQTAVTGKDLFALEDFHYQLKAKFKELGYNYEVQRKDKLKKGRGNKLYNYLFDKKFSYSFYAKDIVQAYASGIYFMPAKARSISNLVPGGQYYNKLFNNSLTPKDARFYLFPYGVMYYAKYVLEYRKKEKFKSASLLYITIYFKLLLKVLKNIKLVDDDLNYFIEKNQDINIEYINKIFANEKINIKLLGIADSILKNFMKDSKIKDKIGDNLPKFLKSSVESDPEVIYILQNKIMDEFDDENIDLDEIKNLFTTSKE